MAMKHEATAPPPTVTAAKAKIVIEMGGGLIQHILGNGVEVEIAVVENDADDVDPGDLILCPSLSGEGDLEETYAVMCAPEEDAQRVEEIFEAIAKAQRIDS